MTTSPVVRPTTRRRRDDALHMLVDLAADLTSRVYPSQDFVERVQRTLRCDSAVLLRLEGDVLLPVAAAGLVPELMSQRFALAEHPRFAQILRRRGPIRFGATTLPDPFDGLLASGQPLSRVHACLGAPLIVEGEIEGVLALDALVPEALDDVDDLLIQGLATLAAVGLRTTRLVDQLERKATRSEQLVRQLVTARDGGILCQSEPMRAVRREADLAATSDLAILITGETGTGKEVVARAIHARSSRADEPLVYINCAALPESVAESELFGHARGAFTGAVENRAGKFEIADHGTLFLDEVGELPLSIQAKLLRALQSGEIQRVGSDQTLRVDVRIIAATNRDLEAEVGSGRFRADLFHRLSVYPIHVPALRERADDILLLAGFFLDEARIRLGLGNVRLTTDARAALLAYDWPGNVRELEHAILRAALRASGGRRRETVIIDAATFDLPRAARAPAASPVDDGLPLEHAVEALKRRLISEAVGRCDGNWARAARQLGLDRGNLHRMAKRLGMHG